MPNGCCRCSKGFSSISSTRESEPFFDFKPDQDYAALRACIENDRISPDIDALDEYLNFFDFIAQLEQLKLDEIDKLFNYYLDDLASQPFLRQYSSAQGFRSLKGLIAKMEEKHRFNRT